MGHKLQQSQNTFASPCVLAICYRDGEYALFIKHIDSITAEQYLKAANLLVYLLILQCRDNSPIDDWAWALVENEEQCRDFPWGSWSWQILCHQLDVAKKDPSEIENDQKKYHVYGPVWGLNLWAYEAIPSLGRSCGYQPPQRAELMPRLRRWETYSTYSSFAGFFDNPELEVHARLRPSEEEQRQPYLLSLENPNPLVLEYDAPKRHAHKKAEPEQRRSKAAREMAKVVDRLRCREAERVVIPRRATRASSEGQLATRPFRLEAVDWDMLDETQSRRRRGEGPSKRTRAEPSRHEESSDVVCCIHGDPCRHGCRGDDAAMDRFIERPYPEAS
ncbi:hypothetical protein OROMI_008197 [Orobanche minor]